MGLFLLVLSGCGKSSDCLTSSGSVIREERHTNPFDSIELQDYVNLILTQDSMDKVEVEAGENVINGISTDVVDNKLIIRNHLQCNWLRSYSKPLNVYVSVRNLEKIYYNSAGNITTTNAITGDNLILDIWGGAGNIDLNLNIGEGFFLMHMGSAYVHLHGTCGVSSLYAGDFGLFRCDDLKTGYSFITNQGSNDCYVNAFHYLDATIASIGNIYYAGNPDSVVMHLKGSGKLIKL